MVCIMFCIITGNIALKRCVINEAPFFTAFSPSCKFATECPEIFIRRILRKQDIQRNYSDKNIVELRRFTQRNFNVSFA